MRLLVVLFLNGRKIVHKERIEAGRRAKTVLAVVSSAAPLQSFVVCGESQGTGCAIAAP